MTKETLPYMMVEILLNPGWTQLLKIVILILR